MEEKELAKQKLKKANMRVALILGAVAVAALAYSIAYLPLMLLSAKAAGG